MHCQNQHEKASGETLALGSGLDVKMLANILDALPRFPGQR